MKKITILAAFALASTGVFAQQQFVPFTAVDPDAKDYRYEWGGTNWVPFTSPEAEGAAFENGKAYFTDEAASVHDEEYNGPYTGGYSILFNSDGVQTTGIEITADTIRFDLKPDVRTRNLTGADGAQLVKDGEGAFYTDVDLKNMTTVLKNGTLGRLSKESAESAVFGSKIAVEPGAHATLVMSAANSTGTAYFPALNVDSLVIGDGAELHFFLPSYGKMRTDTTVHIAGKGTINFYVAGTRFFAGGNKDWHSKIFFNEETGQWSNKNDDWSSKNCTSKWEDYVTDFSGFEGKVTLQNNLEENDSTVSLFILGAGNGHTNDFVSKVEGDSTVYNIWKAAKAGDPEKTDILNTICLNWKNIDLEIDNLGALSCSSTGGGTTLVRTRSLTLGPRGMVIGYYKDSNPNMIIMTGSDNEDRHIAGTFSAAKKNGSDQEGYQIWNACGAGLIKEGTGTYVITAIDNTFLKGIDVYEGAVMFNNPDPENTSATGQAQSGATVICREDALIGGTGTIGGTTELYGTLVPGNNSIATFRIDGSHAERSSYAKAGSGIPNNIASGNAFFKGKASTDTIKTETDTTIVTLVDTTYYGTIRGKGSNANLYIHNGAKMEFELTNKDHYDNILVQRDIRFMEGKESKVNLSLAPRGEWSVAEGDTLVLMKSYRAYGSSSDEVIGPESFELSLSGLGTAVFKLDTLWTPAVQVWNPDKQDYDEIDSEWQLIAVATAAGSGTAEAEMEQPDYDAIEEVEAAASMQVYPNPAVDNVTVALPADVTGVVAIYNLAGQLVKSVAATDATVSVGVDDLAAGVYTVLVQTPDKVYNQRLIVK